MADIDYETFSRLLLRSAEVAAEPGMKASIVLVYETTLKEAAARYLAADAAVTKAASAFAKENKESLQALDDLEQPYRETRSAVAAIVPTLQLPDTLKVQPTDTDKLRAIEQLLDVLDDYAGQAWADKLLTEPFAVKAAATIKEIQEAIQANKGLSSAREARAEAYGLANDRFFRFKRLVRDALGSTSKQYKRIHLRSQASHEAPEKGGGEGGGGQVGG
ncbi:Hypothetical protein A7982_07971 [Minicystis rosea]|nr:Hypothetical protein A7982_07971 [Minicystis rosea]